MTQKPKLLIFDVNETLLNMQPLKNEVNLALDHGSAFDIWFPVLLHYSLVETVAQRYNGFGKIAASTLDMVSRKLNVPLQEEKIKRVLSTIKELPPFEDVFPGLSILQKAGFKMAALTNGDLETVKAQLDFAGISPFFDAILSVEKVEAYKPHRAAYDYALKTMQCHAHEAMMIAAHGWDVFGAQEAGLRTCFIQRKGQYTYTLAMETELHCADLLEMASLLDNNQTML